MRQAEFDLENYNYELPEELIAQSPCDKREYSKLLVYNRQDDAIIHATFLDIAKFLPKDALIIANNSKVIPARIFGKRENGKEVEMLLMSPISLVENEAANITSTKPYNKTNKANVLIKASKKIKIAEEILFPNFMVKILEKHSFGQHLVQISWQGSLTKIFEQHGTIPLPPYIKRPEGILEHDALRYQTVYAKTTGSVAAPTAGLHFSKQTQEHLIQNGFEWQELTLHVGYGTFSPVRSSDIRTHIMHSEYVEIKEETARAINKAKKENRPIIAIGTTSVRSLEGMALQYEHKLKDKDHILPNEGCFGFTDIFIYPGKEFKVISGLVSNFHLPKSSLLMLISAFAGRENIIKIYQSAIKENYRFFSYGDATLII